VLNFNFYTVYHKSGLKTIKNPPKYTAAELKNIMNDLFQLLAVKINITDEIVTMKQIGGGLGRNAKPITYNTVKFSFSVPQNPTVWRDILTKFSGLIITNIKYDSISGIWNYEGLVYVK